MAWLRGIVRRFRGVLSRSDADEVQAELQSHLDLLADEYRAAGLPEAGARARAERVLGNRTRIAEQTREVATYPWIEGLLKDVVYAARQLRKTPGVTLLAMTSLAVGIGANTAVFSVVNALMLRTLPVPHADRLAAVSLGDHDVTRVDGSRWSYAFWRSFAQHQAQFDGMFAWSPTRVNVSIEETTDTVDGVFVNGAFFASLGVPMRLGRALTPDDDREGAPGVAIVSHGYWHRQFGGRPDVLGRTVTLHDTPVTIVGVMPAAFSGLEVGQAPDVVLPLAGEPWVRGSQSFTRPPFDAMNMWLRVGVRLKPGQSLSEGSALVQGLQPQLREAALPPGFPQLRETFLQEPMGLVSAATGLSRLRQIYRPPLDVLRVVVALVLLLASVNVANLLLAQTTARGHELGVRLALGGSRWRVARQLLVEASLLTAGGLALGTLAAQWVARVLIAQFSSPNAPVTLDVGVDWRTFAATALVGVVTTLACGTAAALRVNAIAPAHALLDAARGVVGASRTRAAHGLLTLQLALSLTLIVGAGLFVATFEHLTSVPLGFDRGAVLLANANAGRTDVAPAARLAFYKRLVEAVRAVPGVEHAAASSMTPVSASFAPIVVTPTPPIHASGTGEATSMFVTPGWFATYGLPMLAGRDIDASDVKTSAPVMVVNRAFADRFFGGRDALGALAGIAVGRKGEMVLQARTIVGIVDNAIYRSLRESAQPTAYIPLAQYDYPIPMNAFIAISARAATAAPAALAHDVTAALTSVHSRLSVTTRTLDDQVRDSVRQEQLLASISAVFGVIALFLAAIGLFGVTSYAVSRRRREIAVRVAVGAARRDIVRTVMSRVIPPLVLGVALGLTLSTWLSRFAASLFFGVEPGDLTTLVLGSVVLVGTAVLAAWIPARRALRISPVEALRA